MELTKQANSFDRDPQPVSENQIEASWHRSVKMNNIQVYRGQGIGTFKVRCGGRLIVPGQWYTSLFTWVLILGPSITQMTLVNPDLLMTNKSNFAIFSLQIAYVLTMCLSLLTLTFTTFSDPGIVPRQLPCYSNGSSSQIFQQQRERLLTGFAHKRPP